MYYRFTAVNSLLFIPLARFIYNNVIQVPFLIQCCELSHRHLGLRPQTLSIIRLPTSPPDVSIKPHLMFHSAELPIWILPMWNERPAVRRWVAAKIKVLERGIWARFPHHSVIYSWKWKILISFGLHLWLSASSLLRLSRYQSGEKATFSNLVPIIGEQFPKDLQMFQENPFILRAVA